MKVVIDDADIRSDDRVARTEAAIIEAAGAFDGPWHEFVFGPEGRDLMAKLAQRRVMVAVQLRRQYDAEHPPEDG